MQGIMHDGIGAVRGEERGHARYHVGWDGSLEGERREVMQGSCRLRGSREERGHVQDHVRMA